MMQRFLFLILCCFWGLFVFAEEAIPTHTIIEGEKGLSVIVDKYYDNYAGESNGYNSKKQYSDSLVKWNNMSKDSKGNPIISVGQTLYLINPKTFHDGLGDSQEQKKKIINENEEVVAIPQAKPVNQEAASAQMEESQIIKTGDGGNVVPPVNKPSISWIWLLFGVLIGLALGVVLFYLLYVKKLKADYRYIENELNQAKFDLNSEKTSTGSELSRLRSKIQSLDREKQRLFEENVSLGEEIDRLKAAQSRVNENRMEQTASVSMNQASTQSSDSPTALYADAIIDGYFVRISEVPNEDSIFVLHLNGENSANFDIYGPAHPRIIANPSFLEGCEKQILGNTMQLDVIEGRSQRDASNGKWKIIEKLNVIIK